MSRDVHAVRRSAFVIIGGLVAVIAVVAMLYGSYIRPDDQECEDGAKVLLFGLCYRIWLPLLPLMVLGMSLAAWGLFRYRSAPSDLEGYLHFGTGTHFLMALLLALVTVPVLGWVTVQVLQGADRTVYVLPLMGSTFEMTFLLELLMLLGVLMLVPFLLTYIAHARLRASFLEAVDRDERDEEE